MLREVYYDAEAKLRPCLVGRAREAMLNSLETLHRELTIRYGTSG